MHFQSPHLGHDCRQLHGDFALVAGILFIVQHAGQRRQAQVFARIQVDDLAQLGRRARLKEGSGQVEAHGPAQAQREQALRQADFLAAGAATGQDADGAVVFARFAQHEEITARRAAADARRLAASGQRVGDGATRHGHVGIIVVQDGQGQGRAAPVRERLGQAARQRVGAEHAAVQQQGVGQCALMLL